MINPQSCSKEWILSQSKSTGKADPNLIELVIYAFNLLELLIVHKLQFVFKGGTSLLLLLKEPKRFSTDIDILCTASQKQIEAILEEICKTSVFSRWALDDRRSYKPGIPKAHYKLFFISELDSKEKEIMLDVLIEKPDYPEIISKEIKLNWLQTEGEHILVSVPSTDAILGDKLCAFAPDTIGVPYNAGKDREIAKQLYDIGLLVSHINNIDIVAQSFKVIAAKEISYKTYKVIMIDDVYRDIRNTAFIMAHGFRDKYESDENKKKYQAIENGRTALKSFIIGTAMVSRESVLLAATQAAYITLLIQLNKTETFSLFNEKHNINNYLFSEPPQSMFNKLSKLPCGILYYLRSISDLTR